MNKYFSFKRLWLGMRKSLLLSWKNQLALYGAIAAVYMLISLTEAYKGSSFPWTESLFLPLLVLGGMITASTSFREYSDKNKNLRALVLPLSSVERFLEKWILNTPGFILGVMVFTFLVSLLANALDWIIFRNFTGLFNPFGGMVWKFIPYFLVIQSLFYLGSAWFRKSGFFKTLLVLSVLPLVFGLIFGLLMRIFMAPYIQGAFWVNLDNLDFQSFPFNNDYWNRLLQFLIGLAKTLFWMILPFCYGISWLRIREKEVRHGV